MRAFYIILTVFLFQSISFAQQTNDKTILRRDAAGNPIATVPIEDGIACCWCDLEIPAKINHVQWTKYLSANLLLNNNSLDTIPPGRYQVMVRFIIDEKGAITDVSIVSDPGHGLGLRALNIVSNYKERCEPAIQRGRNVKSFRKQPLTFVIEEEEECEDLIPAEPIP